MAWRLVSKIFGAGDFYESIQGKASQQYVAGGLVKMSAGLPVPLAGQTDQPTHMIDAMDPQPYNGQGSYNVNGYAASPLRPVTPLLTTTVGERVMGVPISGAHIFECDVAPLLSRVAAVSNAAKGSAVCAYGGSTSDFNGGTVYLPEQDWQGVVVTSVVGAGNVTLVFVPAAPRACTTGDTVSALPFGFGNKVKWDGTNYDTTLSNAVADNTGGLALVRKVDMQFDGGTGKGSLARVRAQITSPI